MVIFVALKLKSSFSALAKKRSLKDRSKSTAYTGVILSKHDAGSDHIETK